MPELVADPQVQAWVAEQPRLSEQVAQHCQRVLDRWAREQRRQATDTTRKA